MSVEDFPFLQRVGLSIPNAQIDWLCKSGLLLQYALSYKASSDELRRVIKLGADANQCDSAGRSPLIYAIHNSNAVNLRILLEEAGALLTERDIDYAWVQAGQCHGMQSIYVLEYLLMKHLIPLRQRRDLPGTISLQLVDLLMKIRARIARCQRTCLAWLVDAQGDKRLRALVAKPLAVRIARAVWETRRQGIWWQ